MFIPNNQLKRHEYTAEIYLYRNVINFGILIPNIINIRYVYTTSYSNMGNYTKGRTKIEKLGLSSEVLRLKGEGKGSISIAKAVSAISGEKVNSTNIDNFFSVMKETAQDNKALTQAINTSVKEVNLKILSNWNQLDDEISNLLVEAKAIQQKCVGVDKNTGAPLIINFKDLRLWKDVLESIAKISEIRLRTLGQIQAGGKHITFNFIESQYNNLQQAVLEAESLFPGLNKWIEQHQYSKGETTIVQ